MLKTIGFSDRRLFGMVMLEAGDHRPDRRGDRPGRRQAAVQGQQLQRRPDSCPDSTSPPSTLVQGAGVALLLMLASGLVPAMRAARLPVVQALRTVE